MHEQMRDTPPSIFEYLDYQIFLRDAFDHRRVSSPGFSFSTFARRTVGMSKQHLSMIVNGKRKIPAKRVATFGAALGLSHKERRYFENLVQLNHSKTDQEKAFFLSQLTISAPPGRAANLTEKGYGILYSWHCLVILEMIRLPAFRPSGKWISNRLRGRVSALEARRALNLLLDLGLVAKDKNGCFLRGSQTVRTTDELKSLAVQKYHGECLVLGQRVLREQEMESREFGSVNLLLEKSRFPQIKEKLKQFREEILEMAWSGGGGEASVCQLNLQFFNLEK